MVTLNIAHKTILMHGVVEDGIDKMAATCSYCKYTMVGGLESIGLTKINSTEILRAGLSQIFLGKDIDKKKRKLEILIREIYDIRNCHGEPLSDTEIQKLINRLI